jgi:hypothetical protein
MNRPLAPSIASIIGLESAETAIRLPGAGAPSESQRLRRALHALERIGGGWRPGAGQLARARRLDRWTAQRPEGGVYQLVGFAANAPNVASTTVATLLAIDPEGCWALLYDDTWAALGAPVPGEAPPDPSDVLVSARAWLLRQMG